jgi:hypothetical protein
MSFGLYALGFAIVIGGLIYAAYLLHLPAHRIAVGAIVLFWTWHSDRSQSHASEGSCGMSRFPSG